MKLNKYILTLTTTVLISGLLVGCGNKNINNEVGQQDQVLEVEQVPKTDEELTLEEINLIQDSVKVEIHRFMKTYENLTHDIGSQNALRNIYSNQENIINVLELLEGINAEDDNMLYIYFALSNKETVDKQAVIEFVNKKYTDDQTEDDVSYADVVNNNIDVGFILSPPSDLPETYDASARPWYIDAVEADGPVWSEVYEDAFTGKIIISIADELRDNNDQRIGVLGADLHLDELLIKVAEIEKTQSCLVKIADKNGVVIYNSNKYEYGLNLESLNLGEVITSEEGQITYEFLNEEEEMFYVTDELSNWKIMIVLTEDEE